MYPGHSPPPVSASAIDRVRRFIRPFMIGLGVLMALFAIVGFFLPRTMTVRQQVAIRAPVGSVFSCAADLGKWPEWLPSFRKDAFGEASADPAAGGGSILKWTSSKGEEVRVKITREIPPSRLSLAFDFGTRAEVTGECVFTESDGTTTAAFTLNAAFGGNTGRRWWGLIFRNSIENDLLEALQALQLRVEQKTGTP